MRGRCRLSERYGNRSQIRDMTVGWQRGRQLPLGSMCACERQPVYESFCIALCYNPCHPKNQYQRDYQYRALFPPATFMRQDFREKYDFIYRVFGFLNCFCFFSLLCIKRDVHDEICLYTVCIFVLCAAIK